MSIRKMGGLIFDRANTLRGIAGGIKISVKKNRLDAAQRGQPGSTEEIASAGGAGTDGLSHVYDSLLGADAWGKSHFPPLRPALKRFTTPWKACSLRLQKAMREKPCAVMSETTGERKVTGQ